MPKALKIVLQPCPNRAPIRFPPASPPMRPNMNMKHVAMPRIFVGYKLTEIALTMLAHKLLLTNVTNAITIAWNCVRKFKANADTDDKISQTADDDEKLPPT